MRILKATEVKHVSGGFSTLTGGKVSLPSNPVEGTGPVHVPIEGGPVQVTINTTFTNAKANS